MTMADNIKAWLAASRATFGCARFKYQRFYGFTGGVGQIVYGLLPLKLRKGAIHVGAMQILVVLQVTKSGHIGMLV